MKNTRRPHGPLLEAFARNQGCYAELLEKNAELLLENARLARTLVDEVRHSRLVAVLHESAMALNTHHKQEIERLRAQLALRIEAVEIPSIQLRKSA